MHLYFSTLKRSRFDTPPPLKPLYPELDRLSGRQPTQFHLGTAIGAAFIHGTVIEITSMIAIILPLMFIMAFFGMGGYLKALFSLVSIFAILIMHFLAFIYFKEKHGLWPSQPPLIKKPDPLLREDLYLQTVAHLLALSDLPPNTTKASWKFSDDSLHMHINPRPSISGHIKLKGTEQGACLAAFFENAAHRHTALEQMLTSPQCERLLTALKLAPSELKPLEVHEEDVSGLALTEFNMHFDPNQALQAAKRRPGAEPLWVEDPRQDPAVALASLIQLMFVAVDGDTFATTAADNTTNLTLADFPPHPHPQTLPKEHGPRSWQLSTDTEPRSIPLPPHPTKASWPGVMAMVIFVLGVVAFMGWIVPEAMRQTRGLKDLHDAAFIISVCTPPITGAVIGFLIGEPRFASGPSLATRQLRPIESGTLTLESHILSNGQTQIALMQPFEVHWTGWHEAQSTHGTVTLTLGQRTSRLRVQVVGVEVDEAFGRLERLDVRAPQCAPDVFAKELWPLIAAYEAIT